MMYTYDTEFVELGRERKVLPLSIGMVSGDGREFYAQYIEGGGLAAAIRHDWVRQNVLPHLRHIEFKFEPDIVKPQKTSIVTCGQHGYDIPGSPAQTMLCGEPDCPWMMDAQIAAKLIEFVQPSKENKPEIWAYYADYDHVVLSQTFGTMMDLPPGWPMYTRDLKQWSADIERRVNQRQMSRGGTSGDVPPYQTRHPAQPIGEHDALIDASWNMTLYQVLETTEMAFGLL